MKNSDISPRRLEQEIKRLVNKMFDMNREQMNTLLQALNVNLGLSLMDKFGGSGRHTDFILKEYGEVPVVNQPDAKYPTIQEYQVKKSFEKRKIYIYFPGRGLLRPRDKFGNPRWIDFREFLFIYLKDHSYPMEVIERAWLRIA